MRKVNWKVVIWVLMGVVVFVGLCFGLRFAWTTAVQDIQNTVAAEVWARQPKVAAPPSADEIAERVIAKLPEVPKISADEIAANVVALMPESASAEQVAALLVSTPITEVVRVELPECIRICPTEAITPTVTPTTTVSATLAVTPTTPFTPTCKDIYFDGGDINVVPAGFVIAGDVDVWADNAWKALYDSLEKTGLITVLTKETKVRALWGADASDCHKVANIKEGMLASGCSGGCSEVTVVNWPN